jgi:hypothetical protein
LDTDSMTFVDPGSLNVLNATKKEKKMGGNALKG